MDFNLEIKQFECNYNFFWMVTKSIVLFFSFMIACILYLNLVLAKLTVLKQQEQQKPKPKKKKKKWGKTPKDKFTRKVTIYKKLSPNCPLFSFRAYEYRMDIQLQDF